jgi:hypothetical protein
MVATRGSARTSGISAMISFEQIFKTDNPTRDKFLSRLFGLFSEDLVRIWLRTGDSPYENLGKPALALVGTNKRYTLDFTLKSKQTGNAYIGELKSWMEYDK